MHLLHREISRSKQLGKKFPHRAFAVGGRFDVDELSRQLHRIERHVRSAYLSAPPGPSSSERCGRYNQSDVQHPQPPANTHHPWSCGNLEALLVEGQPDARYAALVCHPHPKGGGTMHNKVVYRAAKTMHSFGFQRCASTSAEPGSAKANMMKAAENAKMSVRRWIGCNNATVCQCSSPASPSALMSVYAHVVAMRGCPALPR